MEDDPKLINHKIKLKMYQVHKILVEIFSRERETTSTIFVEDDLTLCILDFVFIYVSMINVRKKLWFIFRSITTILGGWLGSQMAGQVAGLLENKTNSVQLQLQLPTRTELGKIKIIKIININVIRVKLIMIKCSRLN